MDENSGLFGSYAGLEFVAAVALLLSALGLWFWYDQQAQVVLEGGAVIAPAPQEEASVAAVAPAPATPLEEAMPEAEPEPEPEAEVAAVQPQDVQATAPAQPDAPATGNAPRFDEVRRERDGLTVIAGRAAPGSTVRVLLDGEEVAVVVADQNGSFAAITQADADGQGHVLSLSADDGAGETVSEDEILLTPLAPVVASLEAEPEPTPLTQTVEPQASAPAAEKPAAEGSTPQEADVVSEAEPEPAAPAAEIPQDTSQQVAVLKSDAEGVELLQTGRAPEVMSTVALDTISYSEAGDVQLSGRAQDGTAEVRVYLDNAPLTDLAVDVDGRWRGDLPNVDEGIYTLRVDELNAEGAVTSRVETPFKRESPQVLADAAAGANGPLKAITVQKGATLWAIARDRYGDGTLYVRVFEANADAIRDPDLIYPGQVFDLPN